MKHIKLIFFVVALFSIISSCRKVIEPKDLPQQDPRIVLNCVMYPDSQITTEISVSKSILSTKEYKYITDAACELYENNTYVEKLTSLGKGKYEGNTKAVINKNYTIKVTAPGYNGVSGSSAIPQAMVISTVEQYDTTNSKFVLSTYKISPTAYATSLNGSTKYRFVIKDDITVKNYYSIRAVAYLYDTSGTEKLTFNPSIYSNANSVTSGGYSAFGLNFDDASLTNGNEIKVDVSVGLYQSLDPDFELKTVEVHFLLYTFSPEYYKYVSTLNSQAETNGSLFSEPVQIYSNISNGMGIMAGANVSTVKIYEKNLTP